MDLMSDDVALRPGQPLGLALSATARELLAKVGLSETGTEAEAIHDFRRAVKRWRAFLRLAEPIVGESARALRDEARDIARSLAGARDAQAALDASNDLGERLRGADSAYTRHGNQAPRRYARARRTEDSDARNPRLLQMLQTTTTATVGEWPLDNVHFRDVAKGLTADTAVRAMLFLRTGPRRRRKRYTSSVNALSYTVIRWSWQNPHGQDSARSGSASCSAFGNVSASTGSDGADGADAKRGKFSPAGGRHSSPRSKRAAATTLKWRCGLPVVCSPSGRRISSAASKQRGSRRQVAATNRIPATGLARQMARRATILALALYYCGWILASLNSSAQRGMSAFRYA